MNLEGRTIHKAQLHLHDASAKPRVPSLLLR